MFSSFAAIDVILKRRMGLFVATRSAPAQWQESLGWSACCRLQIQWGDTDKNAELDAVISLSGLGTGWLH